MSLLSAPSLKHDAKANIDAITLPLRCKVKIKPSQRDAKVPNLTKTVTND